MTDIMSGIMCVFCCFQILCISCANGVYFSIFPLYFCVMFVSFRIEMSLRYVVFSFLFVKVTSGLLYYTVLSVCVSCHSVVIIVHFLLLLWVYICNMALCCFLARMFVSTLYIIFVAMLCFSVPASILHPAVMWSIVSDVRLYFLHLSSCVLVSFIIYLR